MKKREFLLIATDSEGNLIESYGCKDPNRINDFVQQNKKDIMKHKDTIIKPPPIPQLKKSTPISIEMWEENNYTDIIGLYNKMNKLRQDNNAECILDRCEYKYFVEFLYKLNVIKK
jgi:hypothetical protein